jgi:hypothetical protein
MTRAEMARETHAFCVKTSEPLTMTRSKLTYRRLLEYVKVNRSARFMLYKGISMKKAFVILVVMLAARWLAAQGTTADTCAPVLLYTNGAGSFSPYQCGQMLQTGQVYTVSAIPNNGSRFDSWRQVQVTVKVKTIIYPSSAIVSTTNTVTTPTTLRYSKEATLKFHVEAPTVQVIENNPGTTTTTKTLGWEANFTRDRYDSWSKMY